MHLGKFSENENNASIALTEQCALHLLRPNVVMVIPPPLKA